MFLESGCLSVVHEGLAREKFIFKYFQENAGIIVSILGAKRQWLGSNKPPLQL
jgi:hypothetical protein